MSNERNLIDQKNPPKHFWESFSLAISVLAVLITAVGWWMAFVYRDQFASPSLWPMPGLFLIHWTLVCLLGVLAVSLQNNRAAWFLVGALIPMVVFSAWSFGILTLLSCLFLLLAALFIPAKSGHKWLETLGVVTLGAITNLVILKIILAII